MLRSKNHSTLFTYQKNRFRKRYFIWVLFYLLGYASLDAHPTIASATNCDDLRFVFARGSGEELNGPSYTAWKTEIENDFSGKGLRYGFYELGSAKQSDFQYPAVAVAGDIKGYINLAGAAISGGAEFDFGTSVKQGLGELRSYLKGESLACPGMRFVLGGYSQGAMIMSQSLRHLDAEKILYVATFGDPKIYLPEGRGEFLDEPDACKGKNLSDYRVYVPDCYTYEGILGSYQPYVPDNFRGKVGVWCNTEDIMCSSHMSVDSHTSYVSDNLYADATDEIYDVARQSLPNKLSPSRSRPLHEVAFVVDSSGSMRFKIKSCRNKIRYLASEIIRGGGRVALVEYRDLWDSDDPMVRINFTRNQDAFEQVLDNISPYRDSRPVESALAALRTALDSLSWSNGATKSAFIFSDEGYLSPDVDGTTIEDVVQRSLAIDPVNIYASIHSDSAEGYKKITSPTNGLVLPVWGLITDEDISKVTDRPVAKLSKSSYSGQIGDVLYFDASSSYALDGGNLQYDWDLDGDGVFELNNSGPKVSHLYSAETSHYIQLRVTDQNGRFSTMSSQVEISPPQQYPDPVSISNLTQTWLPNNELQIEASTDAKEVFLANGDALMGFLKVENGTAKFKLKEIEKPTDFSLIPYSKQEIRGTSYNFTVSPLKSEPDQTDKQEPADEYIDGQPLPEHQTEHPPEHYVGLVDPRKIALPKVPKAGIAKARRKED